jgi:hypothetical protein
MNSAPYFFTYNYTAVDTDWHQLPAIAGIAEGEQLTLIAKITNVGNISIAYNDGTTDSEAAPITLTPGAHLKLRIKNVDEVAVKLATANDVLEYVVEKTQV